MSSVGSRLRLYYMYVIDDGSRTLTGGEAQSLNCFRSEVGRGLSYYAAAMSACLNVQLCSCCCSDNVCIFASMEIRFDGNSLIPFGIPLNSIHEKRLLVSSWHLRLIYFYFLSFQYTQLTQCKWYLPTVFLMKNPFCWFSCSLSAPDSVILAAC